MNLRINSRRGLDRVPSPPSLAPEPSAQGDAMADMAESERRVLRCLQDVEGGMTLGQLEASLEGLGNVRETVDSLIERSLAIRLNTVVPSYTSRRPDAGVHAG